jgi:hypothetical protein
VSGRKRSDGSSVRASREGSRPGSSRAHPTPFFTQRLFTQRPTRPGCRQQSSRECMEVAGAAVPTLLALLCSRSTTPRNSSKSESQRDSQVPARGTVATHIKPPRIILERTAAAAAAAATVHGWPDPVIKLDYRHGVPPRRGQGTGLRDGRTESSGVVVIHLPEDVPECGLVDLLPQLLEQRDHLAKRAGGRRTRRHLWW